MARCVLASLTAILLLTSCGGQTVRPQEGGDRMAFKYATLLSVVAHDGYTSVEIANPWKQDKTLHTYILVPRDAELPAQLPEGTVIRTPVQRALVCTTVHCSLMMSLERQDRITGVADLKYIKIPWIQEQARLGRIADCGNGMSPVVEKIIDLHPDAILISPFENSGGYGRLEEIDVPLVECADYMEVSPLARAEWMRFYGLLFGAEEKADSLFSVVDDNYNALRKKAQEAGKGRSVVVDKKVGSVWYVPGGRSTIGQMIKDAGAQYPYADDEHSGSVSLPFEAVLDKAGEAEVWLYRYDGAEPMTLSQLLTEEKGYSQFRAYRSGEVYGCNVRATLFYEQSPFRPDWLLNDFIRIAHPDMAEDLEPLRYYQKLNP